MSPGLKAVRSIAGVLAGLIAITAIVEPIEFLLVAAVNRGFTTEQELYLSIRNQTWFLMVKLVYNTLAAIAGGWIAARIAGRAAVLHGLALATVQTAAFLWAIASPDLRANAPLWMWLALILVSAIGIVVGAGMALDRTGDVELS